MPKLIHGFINTETLKYKELFIELVLISRKDCRKIGSRLIDRGIDDNGNCSNYVETEMITIVKSIDYTKINS